MRRFLPLTAIALVSCAEPPAAGIGAGGAANRGAAGAYSPDCNFGASCPEVVAGLDPERCVSDPAPFVVALDDQTGAPVDVHIDEEQLAALKLTEGRWWTVFPAPSGACEGAVTVMLPAVVSNVE